MKTFVLVLVGAVYNACIAWPADTDLIGCVDLLKIPAYPSLARQARLTGMVRVTVVLGDNGLVAETKVNDVERLLGTAVEQSISGSSFRRDCKAHSVDVTFEFKIEGEPSPHHTTGEVSFKPPNHFVIIVPPNVTMP
jgi:hypothetical protein